MASSAPSPIRAFPHEHMPRKRARSFVLDSEGDKLEYESVVNWLDDQTTTPKSKRAKLETEPAIEERELKGQRLRRISDELYLEEIPVMDENTSFTSESVGTINAYSARFNVELERRGIHFIDDEDENSPGDLEEFKAAISASRESPEPEEKEAKIVRKRIIKSVNEAATLQCLLPKYLPIFDIYDGDDLYTVSNQQWDKQSSLQMNSTSSSTALVTPKPDQTIGISAKSLNYPNAIAMFKYRASPVTQATSLLFPFSTIEGKGDQGSLKVSRSQNMWNAAVMLHNLQCVRRVADEEQSFYNQIQAITLALTTESIELCYHWAVKSELDDTTQYLGQAIGCWNPNSKSSADYKDARRCIYNALEWITKKNRAWIAADLSKIEKQFDLPRSLESMRRAQMTPPASTSRSGSVDARKRRASQLYQETRSRESSLSRTRTS